MNKFETLIASHGPSRFIQVLLVVGLHLLCYWWSLLVTIPFFTLWFLWVALFWSVGRTGSHLINFAIFWVIRIYLWQGFHVDIWTKYSIFPKIFLVLFSLFLPLALFLFLSRGNIWRHFWVISLFLYWIMEVDFENTIWLRSFSKSIIRWLKVQEICWDSLLGFKGTILLPDLILDKCFSIGLLVCHSLT